jgi:hypothetical protein
LTGWTNVAGPDCWYGDDLEVECKNCTIEKWFYNGCLVNEAYDEKDPSERMIKADRKEWKASTGRTGPLITCLC